VIDGVVVVQVGELFLQDRDLGGDFVDADLVLHQESGQVGATLPEPVGGGRRVEGLVTGSGTTRAESRPTPGCLVTAIHHVAAAVPRRGVGCGELHRVGSDSIECNPGVGGD